MDTDKSASFLDTLIGTPISGYRSSDKRVFRGPSAGPFWGPFWVFSFGCSFWVPWWSPLVGSLVGSIFCDLATTFKFVISRPPLSLRSHDHLCYLSQRGKNFSRVSRAPAPSPAHSRDKAGSSAGQISRELPARQPSGWPKAGTRLEKRTVKISREFCAHQPHHRPIAGTGLGRARENFSRVSFAPA